MLGVGVLHNPWENVYIFSIMRCNYNMCMLYVKATVPYLSVAKSATNLQSIVEKASSRSSKTVKKLNMYSKSSVTKCPGLILNLKAMLKLGICF